MGKAVPQPASSSPLLACHLGLDSWLSAIPRGWGGGAECQTRRRCFESKKPPELLAAIEMRAFVGGDARCELLPEQWPSRASGDWAGSRPWPQSRPARPR